MKAGGMPVTNTSSRKMLTLLLPDAKIPGCIPFRFTVVFIVQPQYPKICCVLIAGI